LDCLRVELKEAQAMLAAAEKREAGLREAVVKYRHDRENATGGVELLMIEKELDEALAQPDAEQGGEGKSRFQCGKCGGRKRHPHGILSLPYCPKCDTMSTEEAEKLLAQPDAEQQEGRTE
jgi:hypothetical protein